MQQYDQKSGHSSCDMFVEVSVFEMPAELIGTTTLFSLLKTPQALLVNMSPFQFMHADRMTVESSKIKVQEPEKQKSTMNIITLHPVSQTRKLVL